MTTLTHSIDRNCFNSLGIPVDHITREDAIRRITEMARLRDGRPRLVSTLNVDFLINALGTGRRRARHPELLEVLRRSDLVTADGFPILWLSRLAGRPLPHRVCGSDLVPDLAEHAARNGLSLFLLGGGKGTGKRAADTLQERHPNLRIAGTAAPMIHAAGPGLCDADLDDADLVDLINRSGADILLLGLGNPKQELWFNRNRHRLEVPVSIGVGGTFEFIIGNVRRAPRWMQGANLEWVYRISQDPRRLWSRYAEGLVKLAALSLPLLRTRISQTLAFGTRGRRLETAPRWKHLWSARDASLKLTRLPDLVGREYLEQLVRDVQQAEIHDSFRMLDFSRVRHVALSAQHALFTLSELQSRWGDRLVFLGMGRELRRCLASTRVLDLVKPSEGDALQRVAPGCVGERMGCRSYLLGDRCLVFLSGRVGLQNLKTMGILESLSQTTADREVVIDLRNVTLLESTAIVALRNLSHKAGAAGGKLLLSGATADIRQMFQMSELGAPAPLLDDTSLMARIT